MLAPKKKFSIINPHRFEQAVTIKETPVENGNQSLCLGYNLAVQESEGHGSLPFNDEPEVICAVDGEVAGAFLIRTANIEKSGVANRMIFVVAGGTNDNWSREGRRISGNRNRNCDGVLGSGNLAFYERCGGREILDLDLELVREPEFLFQTKFQFVCFARFDDEAVFV